MGVANLWTCQWIALVSPNLSRPKVGLWILVTDDYLRDGFRPRVECLLWARKANIFFLRPADFLLTHPTVVTTQRLLRRFIRQLHRTSVHRRTLKHRVTYNATKQSSRWEDLHVAFPQQPQFDKFFTGLLRDSTTLINIQGAAVVAARP